MDINTFKYRLLDDGMTFIEKGSDHIVGYLSLYSSTDYDEDDTSYDEDISYMCDFDFEHNDFICKPVVLFNSNLTKAFNRFTKNNKTNAISNFNAFVNEYTVRDNNLNIAIKKLVMTLLSLKDKYSNNSIEDEFLTLFEQFIQS